jgi:hypothetical protein
MNKILAASAASALVLSMNLAQADSHEKEARRYVPVETFTCNYRAGKGPADLDQVIGNWNQWMDDNGGQDYFALTLTPHYYGENTFDVGWLGSWPSGEAMGRGTDTWLSKGSEIGEQFDEVLECVSHTNFATTEFKSPGDGPAPDTIVLSFSDCTGPEDPGKWPDLMGGLDGWAQYQAETGYHGATWMMFPAYGGGDFDFDFKMVYGWDNHTEHGQDYQRYGEQEDWEKQGELVGSLMDCDVPRLYDARIRRRPAQED